MRTWPIEKILPSCQPFFISKLAARNGWGRTLRAPLENGSTMQVTIPVFSGSTSRVTTFPNPDCSSGTSCASYVLFVPSSSPVYGTLHLSGTSYTVPPAEPAEVVFHIDGKAYLPGTNTPDCSPLHKLRDNWCPGARSSRRSPIWRFPAANNTLQDQSFWEERYRCCVPVAGPFQIPQSRAHLASATEAGPITASTGGPADVKAPVVESTVKTVMLSEPRFAT